MTKRSSPRPTTPPQLLSATDVGRAAARQQRVSGIRRQAAAKNVLRTRLARPKRLAHMDKRPEMPQSRPQKTPPSGQSGHTYEKNLKNSPITHRKQIGRFISSSNRFRPPRPPMD